MCLLKDFVSVLSLSMPLKVTTEDTDIVLYGRCYKGYNITLKNTKTNRNKRWLITGYELTEKEIVIKLPDETVKRYQTNEWIIVHTSIHYF